VGKVLTPNYFPFCFFPDGNTSPSRTLAKTMYEYWVAKTWRVRVFMQDLGSFPPANPYYDFYFGLSSPTEEDIPCNPPFIYKYGDITENEFIDSGFSSYVADNATSSFIGGYFSRFNEANDDELRIGNLENLDQTGTTNIVFGDGHTISVPYGIASGGIPDPTNFYEVFTGLQITIQDYWSYGGTYDTATGNPL